MYNKKVIIYFTIFYLLILFTVGIYYEDMTDVFISVISQGILTTYPVHIFNNYTAHFLLNHIYSNLSTLYPLGWYGILNLTFQYFALLNTVLLLYKILQPLKKNTNLIIFFISILYLTDDILFLQYTKTSIFLVCSSVLNIILLHLNGEKIKKKVIIINGMFYIIGILLRPQILYLSTLILLPFLLIVRKKITTSLNLNNKITYSIIFTISFIILLISNKTFSEDDKKYAVFAEYKSSVWDGKQPENTLNLQTKKDSTIYHSFQNYFFPDINYINPSYLNKIGIHKAHTPLEVIILGVKQFKFKFNKATNYFHSILKDEKYKIYLLSSLILLLLYLSFQKLSICKKVFFQLIWTGIILFLITVALKMENRILFPVLFYSCICCFIYLKKYTADKTLVLYTIILLNIITSFLYIYGNSFIYKKRYLGQQDINKLCTILNTDKSNKMFLFDVLTFNLFGNNVLESSLNKNKFNCFSLDAGYLIFYKEYTDKREKYIGSNTFKEGILNIKKNSNKFIFIYSPERLNLLRKYVKDVYNINLEFEQTNKQTFVNYPIFGKKIEINSYIIKQE